MMQQLDWSELHSWYLKLPGYSYPFVTVTENGFEVDDDECSGLKFRSNSLDVIAVRPGVYVDPFSMHTLTPTTITSALALSSSLTKVSFCLGYFEEKEHEAYFTALSLDHEKNTRQPDVLLRIDWSLMDLEKPVEDLIFEQPNFGLTVKYSKVYYTDLYHEIGSSFFVLRNEWETPNYGVNALYGYHLQWAQTLQQISDRNFAEYAEHRSEYYQKFEEPVKQVSAVLDEQQKVEQTEEGVLYYKGFAAAYPHTVYYYDDAHYEAFKRHFDCELAKYERLYGAKDQAVS